jgi:hypothetical protein
MIVLTLTDGTKVAFSPADVIEARESPPPRGRVAPPNAGKTTIFRSNAAPLVVLEDLAAVLQAVKASK